jgi:dihydropteroate synthase
VAAATGAGWVALHMQGEPRTMQQAPQYLDVVDEVRSFLLERASRAADAGVEEIWIDPGFGFGKTLEHNLALLNHLDELVGERPVLVGTSRKGFLGKLTGGASVDDRLEASLTTAVVAGAKGASMVRVHDVRFTVDAMRIVGEEVAGVGIVGAAR